ncbi:DUF3157 family protein [Vibrio sp. S17_S38]|uniref:DUF3157 family protein n=1 Tax=Vibrio sp. S17_S38 TaxID=2720229 RepID=UPI001681A65E|nr:DUF3157 family protein [Vibrio sp. S17_S38]MBD1571973.1 DUF3157 family protein [Vibrio sp. S17_S38]
MLKPIRVIAPFIVGLLLMPVSTMAATTKVGTFTLDNGTQVVLNDDFTWEYVLTQNVPAKTNSVSEVSKQAALTQPAAMTSTVAAIKSSSSTETETLTTKAMSSTELLGKTAKNGIAVSLAQAKWDGDKLGLIFTLESSNSDSMVTVLIDATFYNDQGVKLNEQELPIWQAIKRMPETYLRKGEQRQSKVIWVEGIDKQQWKKQLLIFKITELDTW